MIILIQESALSEIGDSYKKINRSVSPAHGWGAHKCCCPSGYNSNGYEEHRKEGKYNNFVHRILPNHDYLFAITDKSQPSSAKSI